ncbi:guanylate kinase [uncultured Tenacibaculum sp.]|uniref:guanylate kinase n=1 Tax=uncultured Tenacibaculum sp. TaxID=174713 RepID=UPI0026080CF2|nr:guanylate kinase [uncultured Tenacibaculum sp.]
MKQNEKVVIFSAPSGAGKTTIVKHLLSVNNQLSFSISACSRAKRNIESNDKDYYFLSVEEFKSKIAANEFIEWEEVYEDNFYGTLKSEVQRIWKADKVIIFDVDVIGGINLKKYFGDKALSIFVKAPSIEELENRLRNRKTETEATLQTRLGKAKREMEYAKDFDVILVNDNPETSYKEAEQIIHSFLNQ